jgi:hypothetical protein
MFWAKLKLSELILSYCEINNIVIWPINNILCESEHHFGMYEKDKFTSGIMKFINKTYTAPIKLLEQKSTIIISDGDICINISIETIRPDLIKRLWLGYSIYTPKDYIDCNTVECVTRSIPIHTADNFVQLKRLTENMTIPFIIRNSEFLKCSRKEFSRLIKNETAIRGYDINDYNNTIINSGSDTWNLFKRKLLPCNIFDSPMSDTSLLPPEWYEYSCQKIIGDNVLSWVLTNSPKITNFHVDPPYGGGLMKIITGEKIWWCVTPLDLKYILDHGTTLEELSKMKMCQITQLHNNYLFGKIYTGIINDGDIIWFPINCLHRVITTKDTYGFGGYL